MGETRVRAGAVVFVLVALAAAVLLGTWLLDPWEGDALDRDADGSGLGAGSDVGRTEEGTPGRGVDPGLRGRFEEADLGVVQARLVKAADSQPLSGHTLRLLDRRDQAWEAVSGDDGVTRFERVPPSRGYRLVVRVPDFAAITVQGIEVLPASLTDLGDVPVGSGIAVRGRVVDERDRPLGGSTVSVRLVSAGGVATGGLLSMFGGLEEGPPAVASAETDAEGWFTLPSVPAGTYALEGRCPGYVSAGVRPLVVSALRPARHLTLVLGEGATLSGSVRDEHGGRISGAEVVALLDGGGRPGGAGSAPIRESATSDPSGRYVLDTLQRGRTYRVGVLLSGQAQVYEMPACEILEPEQTRDLWLSRGGSLEGRVVRREDGQPVAGAEVRVIVGRSPQGTRSPQDTGDETRAVSLWSSATVRTDEDGAFLLESLLPGRVRLARVQAPGFTVWRTLDHMETARPWPEVLAGRRVQAPRVELTQGGTVRGRVTDAAEKQPLSGMTVTLLRADRRHGAFPEEAVEVLTGADGRYAAAGLAFGTYAVFARGDGYGASTVGTAGSRVTISEAEPEGRCDLALGVACAVVGTIRDAAGEPIPGAMVTAHAQPLRPPMPGNEAEMVLGAQAPGSLLAALTDHRGLYAIDGLSAESAWMLRARADGYAPTTTGLFRVSHEEDRKQDLVLQGTGAIEGRVVDPTGQPVPGARVRAGLLPRRYTARARVQARRVERYLGRTVYPSDAGGTFRVPNLAPGALLLRVEKPGYVTVYESAVKVIAGEVTRDLVVTLRPASVLRGVVLTMDAEPLSFANVVAQSPASAGEPEAQPDAGPVVEPRWSDRTDAEGRFAIEGLPPGEWDVFVRSAPGHENWPTHQKERAIRRGVDSSAQDVEFRLEAVAARPPPAEPPPPPGPPPGPPPPPGGGAPPR